MTTADGDRPAQIRAALLDLVAEQGFHGTSMADVAARAGVAAGTIYRYFPSKHELVLAVHWQVKHDLGAAALAGIDPGAGPEQRFQHLWHRIYHHLVADPRRARFLLQAEASPDLRQTSQSLFSDAEHPLAQVAAAPDLAPLLVDAPLEVLYDLGFGPAVRLAARGEPLDHATLERVASACWRAVTT